MPAAGIPFNSLRLALRDKANANRRRTPSQSWDGPPINDSTASRSKLSEPNASRIAWIDYAKGISIILVVMMHSALGVEAALNARGLVHVLVDLATPFRVPAFFVMSGLLLSRSIQQPWPLYLDRKVLHFAYFYLIWLVINCALKYGALGPGAVVQQMLYGLVEPFGTLWFIYILPLFFVAAKLGRDWPALLFASAVALNVLSPQTGWSVIDEFTSRFVFFVAGYLGVHRASAVADWAASQKPLALLALAVSAAIGVAAYASGLWGGSKMPGLALAIAFVGTGAVIAASAILANLDLLKWIRTFGENSLTIYLAFFLPMAATRVLIVRFVPDIGPTAASVIVTIAALVAPLILERFTRGTPLRVLFHRPKRLRMSKPADSRT
jgi:uncharacterized membrane protein YcfT